MSYKQNIKFCFGNKISQKKFDEICITGKKIIYDLNAEKRAGQLKLIKIAEETSDLKTITELAKKISGSFENIVVAGTGGSSLSGQALVHLKPNNGKTPNILFADNVDPHSIELILKLDIKKPFFIIISKSGQTLETLSQFGVFLSVAKKIVGKNFAKNFLIITDASPNPLRNLGNKFGIHIHNHEKVGGRFSGLTSVGLLPAAIAGLDIRLIRKGAAQIVKETFAAQKNIPETLKGAALNVLFMQNKINTIVLMPYVDRLEQLAKWHRQIWSESLGKEGHGTTPVVSMGTIDQHSQLQLYLGGPKDKAFTMLMLDVKNTGPALGQEILAEKELAYLKNKKMGDVMAAEQIATLETLKRNKLPVRTFEFNKINEETIGALMMHFTLETIITGKLLGINPYDQPAVEEGKIIAKKLLERR